MNTIKIIITMNMLLIKLIGIHDGGKLVFNSKSHICTQSVTNYSQIYNNRIIAAVTSSTFVPH